MFKKLRDLSRSKAAGTFIYWLARLYCATFRIKIENESQWINYFEQGGKVLMCVWHQQILSTIHFFAKYRKYHFGVMASKSRDGEFGSGIVEAGGVFTIKGSSSQGGSDALKEMIQRINQYRVAAHVLDGPRGPLGVVKSGAIAIAKRAGAAIIPVVITVDRAWYLRSWDKFMIPKPFARVTIKFCPKIEPVNVPDGDEFEKQRKKLEEIMRPYLRLE